MTYAEYLRRYGALETAQLRGATAVTSRSRPASARRTWAPRPQPAAQGADWLARAQLRRLGIDVRL